MGWLINFTNHRVERQEVLEHLEVEMVLMTAVFGHLPTHQPNAEHNQDRKVEKGDRLHGNLDYCKELSLY